jgi:hypothetical protein
MSRRRQLGNGRGAACSHTERWVRAGVGGLMGGLIGGVLGGMLGLVNVARVQRGEAPSVAIAVVGDVLVLAGGLTGAALGLRRPEC